MMLLNLYEEGSRYMAWIELMNIPSLLNNHNHNTHTITHSLSLRLFLNHKFSPLLTFLSELPTSGNRYRRFCSPRSRPHILNSLDYIHSLHYQSKNNVLAIQMGSFLCAYIVYSKLRGEMSEERESSHLHICFMK